MTAIDRKFRQSTPHRHDIGRIEVEVHVGLVQVDVSDGGGRYAKVARQYPDKIFLGDTIHLADVDEQALQLSGVVRTGHGKSRALMTAGAPRIHVDIRGIAVVRQKTVEFHAGQPLDEVFFGQVLQFLVNAFHVGFDLGIVHLLIVDATDDVEQLTLAHFVACRDHLFRNGRLQFPLDLADPLLELGGDDDDRNALVPGPAGTTAAVGVDFDLVGQAVIDHVGNLTHVNTARGYVGGDKQLEIPLAKTLHHPVAVALGKIAVQGIGVIAVPDHLLGDLLGFRLGTAKDQAVNAGIGIHHPFQGRIPVIGPAQIILMFDVDVGLVHVAGAQLFRVGHVVSGNGPHLVGHGGGEQPDGLAIVHGAEYFVQGVLETHVQHFVGFVEHHPAHVFQAGRLPLDHVQQTARRRHHDLSAGLDLPDLRFDAGAAVHGYHFVLVGKLGVILQVAGNLYAEFAGGAEHDGLYAAFGRIDAL